MRLESDVDHLFFISNNSRTKHKTVKAISKQAPKELDDRHCLRLHHFLSQNSVPSYFLRFLFLAIKIITTVNGYVAVNFCFQWHLFFPCLKLIIIHHIPKNNGKIKFNRNKKFTPTCTCTTQFENLSLTLLPVFIIFFQLAGYLIKIHGMYSVGVLFEK